MCTGTLAVLRRTVLTFVLCCVLLVLNGCGAGIVALVLGIEDSRSSSSANQPPEVEGLEISTPDTPDEIHIGFVIENDGEAELSARIEFEVLDDEGTSLTAPAPATPLPGSASLESIQPSELVRFVWDAKTDLNDDSALVHLIITPIENGVDGKPEIREVRAGNTPVEVRNPRLAPAGDDVLLVIFELVDKESDSASLVNLDVALDGSSFTPLPADLLADFPRSLPSSPEGFPVILEVPLDREDIPDELRAIARPGFVGDICVRVAAQDFSTEPPSRGEACFPFDNNDPPVVILLDSPSEYLESGVIPIRYRLFDREQNPAALRVEARVSDGEHEFTVIANEFPSPASDGTRELMTLPFDATGDSGAPERTFLWDALSQTQGHEIVELTFSASDLEDGRPTNPLRFQLAHGAYARTPRSPVPPS